MTTAHFYHATEVKPRVSIEEYLEREFYAETKSEYINGEIVPLWGTTTDQSGHVVAMAGASIDHLTIASNLMGEIYASLRGKECRVYASDLCVKAEECESYFYPDLTVSCGDNRYTADNPPALLNPSVIIEILSQSTAARDRGEKFQCYLSIPSLREYILVSSHTPRIEHYTRCEDGRWFLSIWVGLGAMFTSETLGAEIPIRGIYAGMDFANSTEEVIVSEA